MENLTVHFESTPNPQSLKFMINRQIVDDPVAFTTSTEAEESPLAQKLFGFPWMQGVFIGHNFVTITKQDWVEWDVLSEPLRELIEEHLRSGSPIIGSASSASNEHSTEQDSDPLVIQIKKVIEDEVRPAVAMDGGDILFHKFENNVVYLKMKGSCSGCPSSSQTLRMGIQGRLQELFPEVREVVAV